MIAAAALLAIGLVVASLYAAVILAAWWLWNRLL